jgi:hypothetical protein
MLAFQKTLPKFVSLMRHQFVNCIKNLMTASKQGGHGLRLALPEDEA